MVDLELNFKKNKMKMMKLKKEWVKDFSVDDIVCRAISLGMEFMARNTNEKELKYNEEILIKELENRIK